MHKVRFGVTVATCLCRLCFMSVTAGGENILPVGKFEEADQPTRGKSLVIEVWLSVRWSRKNTKTVRHRCNREEIIKGVKQGPTCLTALLLRTGKGCIWSSF